MWSSLKAPFVEPTATFVATVAVLSVSSPSGIVLSGSTSARFGYEPGVLGAKVSTVITLGVPVAAGGVGWPVPPVQSPTPDAAVHWNQPSWPGPASLSARMNREPAGRKSRIATW